MNREDAFYYELLLVLGYTSEYDEWLNSYLNTEDPLSDITLDLTLCGSDRNKTISVLRRYRTKEPVDESEVSTRLRLFLKEAFHSDRMDKSQVASAMHTIASHIDDSGDFDEKVWGDMFYFDDYYSMAKDGILTWERFDSAFFDYLDFGISCSDKKLWQNTGRLPLLERIKRLFKK